MNMGNPREFTMLELPKTVIDITGCKSTICHQPVPVDDPRQRRPNIDVARTRYDWEPETQLREGLTRTVAYFEDLLKRVGLQVATGRMKIRPCGVA
jgi:UDP-glucuronate decarboxylase